MTIKIKRRLLIALCLHLRGDLLTRKRVQHGSYHVTKLVSLNIISYRLFLNNWWARYSGGMIAG